MSKIISFVLFLSLFACQNVENEQENQAISEVKAEIETIINAQAAAWNKGNFEGFMDAYWRSDSLRFLAASKLTYGWQAVLDGYKKGYPDKEAVGKLSFKLISLEYIGEEHLLMLGEFHIERTEDLRGNFSLIWKKINGEWKIIFDHT